VGGTSGRLPLRDRAILRVPTAINRLHRWSWAKCFERRSEKPGLEVGTEAFRGKSACPSKLTQLPVCARLFDPCGPLHSWTHSQVQNGNTTSNPCPLPVMGFTGMATRTRAHPHTRARDETSGPQSGPECTNSCQLQREATGLFRHWALFCDGDSGTVQMRRRPPSGRAPWSGTRWAQDHSQFCSLQAGRWSGLSLPPPHPISYPDTTHTHTSVTNRAQRRLVWMY